MVTKTPPEVPVHVQDIEAMQAALKIMSQLDPISNKEMWQAGLRDLRTLLRKLDAGRGL